MLGIRAWLIRWRVWMLGQIADGDLVSIVDFETRVKIGQELTDDASALETAINGTRVGGGMCAFRKRD
jgi:hypothetical protein